MRKTAGILSAAACLAAVGFAGAAPAMAYTYNDHAKSHGNCVGVESSRITHNGAVVARGEGAADQTTTPGSRAAIVHQAQAGTC